MIHDIVLSLLTPNVDTLPIARFLHSKESEIYLHPWEHKVLENIVQIAVQHQDVHRFVRQYSSQARCSLDVGQELQSDGIDMSQYADEHLPKGLYLQALCEGVDSVLLPFRDAVAEVERSYLQTPTHSLMFVYERLKGYQPLLTFLQRLVAGVREQRQHGCALLRYLHRHSLHGNRAIAAAIETIRLSVHRVFLKQLTQWMMYGRFVDAYNEFFIQQIEQPSSAAAASSAARVNNSSTATDLLATAAAVGAAGNNRAANAAAPHNTSFNTSSGGGGRGHRSSGATAAAVAAAATAAQNADMWRYEIGYDQLPPYFTAQWAEKVRFIGQTVVTFNLDPNSHRSAGTSATGESPDTPGTQLSTSLLTPSAAAAEDLRADQRQRTLWNDQEHVFVRKLRAICDAGRLRLDLYEPVVDDIKVYVSERLSEIAIKQADLVRQLRLIKDFFLLGRGEFYLEFIKQTRAMLERSGGVGEARGGHRRAASAGVIDEAMARDITTAFAQAAHNINVVDDLEQFQLSVPLDAAGGGGAAASLDTSSLLVADDEDVAAAAAAIGFIPSIALRYRVRWPLHLLFSPRIIDGYNEMFRFLLQIKRIQYELQMVWCDHRERRVGRDSRQLQLRNKLMFVVNNLQYYLQVDVLEAQFAQLMETVEGSRDFEHIQRAHTVFQANVLGLCFLLGGQAEQSTAAGQTTMLLNRTEFFGGGDNPVLIILNKIMQRVLIFCELSARCEAPLREEEQRALRHCDEFFDGHVAELMRLLSGMRAGPSSAPLAQLLLRLDYNYWFSANEVQRVARAEAETDGDGDEEEEGGGHVDGVDGEEDD